MKKIASLLSMMLLAVLLLNSSPRKAEATNNIWRNIGVSGFTSGAANRIKTLFNPLTNEQYIVYVDTSDSNKVKVKNFNGSSWADVGTSNFSADYFGVSMVFNPLDNMPYVAYQDSLNSYKASVKKFDGSSWIDVGVAGFSSGEADLSGNSIAFNPSTNEPYIVFEDLDRKATVMKFSANSWTIVGTAGFSAGRVDPPSIAFNPLTSEPYVTYVDYVNGYDLTTKKFDGNSWIDVGNSFSAYSSSGLYLTFNTSTNEPFIGYMNSPDHEASLKKFDGSSWVDVGTAGFSLGWANSISVAFDIQNGDPYVAFQDQGLSGKASVKKFDGSSWIDVGVAGFSPGMVGSISLAINPLTNEASVAFEDNASGTRATAMRFKSNSVADPSASVIGGTYDSFQSIILSTTTEGADIYYTTDEYTPTISSTHYIGAITVSSSETIKAIAIKSGMGDSDVMSEIYTIKASTPIASPVGGIYNSSQPVTLSTTTLGADIYYTTNNKTPTVSSTHYTGAITVSSSETIKAIAVKAGIGDSNVMSETYTINPTSSVYRFWSDQQQGHFFTASEAEKDYIIASYPENVWKYEGIAYNSYSTQNAGLVPVYRFWSEQKQHHFYTVSEDEKNYVIANYPENVWKYESIAYYAYATKQNNTAAVYRFWSDTKQGHFFTSDVAEKDNIIANDHSWSYEGTAWYVPTN